MNMLRRLALAWCVLLCALTTGCAQIGEQIPASVGGLPADVPARPQVAAPTPAVHDLPPQRAEKPLDDSQQLKLEKDLAAARARHDKLQDPNAGRRAEDASAASNAALERAKAKAKKRSN
jgi:hypothetical protein